MCQNYQISLKWRLVQRTKADQCKQNRKTGRYKITGKKSKKKKDTATDKDVLILMGNLDTNTKGFYAGVRCVIHIFIRNRMNYYLDYILLSRNKSKTQS